MILKRSFGLSIGAALEILVRQNGVIFWKNWVLLHFYVTISKYWRGSRRLAAPGATPMA